MPASVQILLLLQMVASPPAQLPNPGEAPPEGTIVLLSQEQGQLTSDLLFASQFETETSFSEPPVLQTSQTILPPEPAPPALFGQQYSEPVYTEHSGYSEPAEPTVYSYPVTQMMTECGPPPCCDESGRRHKKCKDKNCPHCYDDCDICEDKGCKLCGYRCLSKHCRSTGDMYQHYPYYPADHGYYYFRPYNYFKVAEQQHLAERWGADPRWPYDTDALVRLYEDAPVEESYLQYELVPSVTRSTKKQLPTLEELLQGNDYDQDPQ
jgi:hypothetical protein